MELSEALKVLSHPTRRAVLAWLANPHKSFESYSQLYDFSVYGVCASLIQDKAGMSQPATSLCLKVLQDMDFVTATKIGKWTYYKRNDEQLFVALSELHSELNV